MVLTNESIKNKAAWEALGYRLPKFDRDAMVAKTVAIVVDEPPANTGTVHLRTVLLGGDWPAKHHQ